jgi:carbon-monoxide dehydrogenase medium subunit
MAFRPDEYLRPRSVEEAVDLLWRHGESAVLISGGITVNELAKRGFLSDVKRLIDIEGVGLSWVRADQLHVKIGASTTYADILRHQALRTPALMSIHEAATSVHPDQVRNIGTVGGAICSGFPFLDLPTGLLPHQVSLTIVGPRGERTVPLEAFVFARLDEKLNRGEMLKEVTIPSAHSGKGSAFAKYGQTALDWAVLNCAASLQVDDEGIVRDARVFAGGKGIDITSPRECAQALTGAGFSDAAVERACEEMAAALPAVSDTRGSAAFKRYTIKRLLRDALGTAYRRAATPWASR